MRNSGDTDASLITPNKKSSGDRPALDVAAAKAAFTRAVFLLGVPGWRPPRLSPGLDPLGIAMFATFYLGAAGLSLGTLNEMNMFLIVSPSQHFEPIVKSHRSL